jgi:8-oxo-dGTP diphosphatase
VASWIEPATWYAQLPACYIAAAMLISDPHDRVLLVRPHYREDWSLPGGVAEDGEPPHLACEREIREELGLDLRAGKLLVVDFVPADTERLRSMVHFVFDGGTVPDSTPITPQADEIAAYSFMAADETDGLVAARTAARLPRALAARRTGDSAYLPNSL